VAEKNQAHVGHELFLAGEVGIGAQSISGAIEVLLYSFDVFKLGHWSL